MSPSKEDDYTKYRTVGEIPYGIEDKIGRKDPTYVKATYTNTTTVSGAVLKSN